MTQQASLSELWWALHIYKVWFTKMLPVIVYKRCATAKDACQEQQPE